MAIYQFHAENLSEGVNIYVRGKLGFAQLTRLIEGDQLAQVNQRKAQYGISPVNQPHTTLTLTEPAVQFQDPNQPSYEENFVQERFFTSNKHPERGQQYSIDSKGSDLPIIALTNPDGTFTQDESGRELAQGLDVTVVLRTYKPKTYIKRGLAIEMILVNEPVQYYSAGGPDVSALASRGITFTSQPRKIRATEAKPTGDVQSLEYDGPDGGYELPQPQAAPAGGYPAQAQQAAPAAQPTQQAPAQPQSQATAVGFAPQAQQAPTQLTREQLEQQLAALQAQQDGGGQGGPNPASAITGNPWNGQRPVAPGITLPHQS